MLPGLLLSAALAALAMQVGTAGWLQAHGISALTVAIVLGIALGNTVYPYIAARSDSGVGFAKKTLLRLGVILYGLRLTLHDVGQVGVTAVLIDALLLTSTFALALFLGTRLFGLDRATAMLIGAGNAICGAAAVMATEPLLRSKAEQVTVAVSTVVVFGTLAIFVYPALYDLNLQWHLLPTGFKAFGIYAGSTIHEVAQVFAAGRSISAATADTAVITKMVRVMMLAPFLILVSGYLARERAWRPVHGVGANCGGPMRGAGATAVAGEVGGPGQVRWAGKLNLPWFAFAFIGMVLFNSLDLLPHPLVADAVNVDTFLLAMAMGALGLTTHASAIRRAGMKPMLLGAVLFVWLIAGGALINSVVAGWMH